jgi:hypothetical protein
VSFIKSFKINTMKYRPVVVYILFILMFFQSVSGIAGGLVLVIGPDGTILHMPLSSLAGSPFHDFLIPGLCLLVLLGLIPGMTAWGLFRKPKSRWFGFFNIYTNRHWSWAYSLYVGLMLIFWMDIEVMVVGYGSLLQAVYGILGLLIVSLTLLPRVMKHYKLK